MGILSKFNIFAKAEGWKYLNGDENVGFKVLDTVFHRIHGK